MNSSVDKDTPAGTPVILTDDNGKEHNTVTMSEPWVVCGRLVVLVDGRRGGYSCDRLRTLQEVPDVD